MVEAHAVAEPAVAGRAPMKQNRPAQDSVRARSPVQLWPSVTCSRRSSPASASTSTPVTSSMFGSASMRSIRYWDIVWVRSSRRIAIVTPQLFWREVDRRLSGGVAAADHQHRRAGADTRLEVGGRVVDAGALEALEVLDGQALVARAGGDDHRSRRDLAAVLEDDHVEAPLGAQTHDLARGVQPRAESQRLDGRARGEVSAGDAVGEARVVLDPRARAGLAADRDARPGRRCRRPSEAP